MTKRPTWVIGNWKMNGSIETNAQLTTQLKVALVGGAPHVRVGVCPTFVHLAHAHSQLATSGILLGAQDVCERDNGAYTGQVSAPMLRELGCEFVLVGHSERRHGLGGRVRRGVARAARRGSGP
jgi:triosephosphate isomerase (TIM)